MPAPAVGQLRDLEHDGQLPAWHTWFGGETALAEPLPDPALRAQFIAELTPLPWKMFTESRPEHPDWPDAPCGYLRLSEAYDADAEEAERRGWPTRRIQTHHLAVLTDAQPITDELLTLVGALSIPS
jgi:hypothetical protein